MAGTEPFALGAAKHLESLSLTEGRHSGVPYSVAAILATPSCSVSETEIGKLFPAFNRSTPFRTDALGRVGPPNSGCVDCSM